MSHRLIATVELALTDLSENPEPQNSTYTLTKRFRGSGLGFGVGVALPVPTQDGPMVYRSFWLIISASKLPKTLEPRTIVVEKPYSKIANPLELGGCSTALGQQTESCSRN